MTFETFFFGGGLAMAIEIKVPEMGEEIEEVTISCWHFKSGEIVKEGQDLVEVTTDKAAFSIECPGDGVLTQIYYEEGDAVDIGEVLGLIEDQEALDDDDSDEEEI